MAQPTNMNFLSPVGYKFILKRAPNVEYFIQRLTLPGLNLSAAVSPNPFANIQHPGDRLDFNQLEVSFRVNENMDNYLEIFNWMIALGTPESFDQYTLKDIPYKTTTDMNDTVRSDIVISVLSSAMNTNLRYKFRDCWPTALSSIDMDSTLTDIDYITASVTFAIRDFTIERV
jgi:hypothetical protein